MATILNASTSSGLVQSADTSGQLELQSNGSTRLTVNGTGVIVAGTGSVSGNLSFNSGYGSSAVAYGCRAWVNFNGTGTVAIRASGNVSSITDNGTGDYTVNFTNAMPDANYTATALGTSNGGDAARGTYGILASAINSAPTTMSTTAVRIIGGGKGGEVSTSDFNVLTIAIFR